MDIEYTSVNIAVSISGTGQIQGISLERVSIELINVNIQQTVVSYGDGICVQRSIF